MKKLLYGIAFLLILSLFISLTQISCQKSDAQLNTSGQQGTPLNLMLLGSTEEKEIIVPTNQVDSLGQPIVNKFLEVKIVYYVMNMDGSNLRKVPITLPPGLFVWQGGHLTPDGTTIVFNVIDKMGGGSTKDVKSYVYSCSLDGSGLRKLADGYYSIQGVY